MTTQRSGDTPHTVRSPFGTTALASVRHQFDKLAPREQRLIATLGGMVILALTWLLAIAPALNTWRHSEAAHAQLDAQLVEMQTLAAQAKALQAVPVQTAAQAQTWLEGSLKKLGKATLSQQGGRVQISFYSASADSLATWLSEARTAAALLPTEAHWKRQDGGKAVLWDGVVLFDLSQ
jgi:general secretion pathway protein M